MLNLNNRVALISLFTTLRDAYINKFYMAETKVESTMYPMYRFTPIPGNKCMCQFKIKLRLLLGLLGNFPFIIIMTIWTVHIVMYPNFM